MTIAGFTVRYALYEGILVVSASDVTLRDNKVENNDRFRGFSSRVIPRDVPISPATAYTRRTKPGIAVGGFTWWELQIRLCRATS